MSVITVCDWCGEEEKANPVLFFIHNSDYEYDACSQECAEALAEAYANEENDKINE